MEKKKSLARSLYLAGMEQTEIADKVGVSRVTVSKWSTADGWKEARAAKREGEKAEKPDTPKREKRNKTGDTNAKFNDFDTEDALMAAILRSYSDESEGEEN